ncbi:MAG: metal-dependent hydrolase [Desulfovermiculus sp.]
MLAPSHIIGGQFAYLFYSWLSGHVPSLGEAMLASAVAVVPDIDHRSSHIGRMFPWISGPLEYWTGHRTFTHSIFLLFLVWLFSIFFMPGGWSLAVISGLASHAVLDMMTPSGVAWFWPARARCVIPGDPKWRMESMGRGELAFCIVLALLVYPVLVAAERGVGVLGTVRDIVGDVESARSFYDGRKSDCEWWLDIRGQDNHAFKGVEGRFKIIGPYAGDGLIVSTEEGPRSICKADACDWYASKAVLMKGEPIETSVRQFYQTDVMLTELIDALLDLEKHGEVFLVGFIQGEGLIDEEPTIQASGEGIRLRYATLEQLARQPDGPVQASLIVQVRHSPGVQVPHPVARKEPVLEVPEREGLDPLLERYLPGG